MAEKTAVEIMQEQHAKLMETMTGLGTVVNSLATRVDSVVTRMDNDEKAKADGRKDAAKGRADAFKFSRKDADEDDDKFKARRDAEEEKLRCDMEEAGETKELAADKAKKRRKDAEEEEDKEAKAKSAKDAEEKEAEEKKKADAARADSVAALAAEVATLKAGAFTALTDDQLNELGRIQSRADSVFTLTGGSTPRYHMGESLLNYRKRILKDMQPMTRFKDIDLGVVAADSKAFEIMEADIIDEATKKARDPATIKPGILRHRTVRGDSGHIVHEFDGSPDAWMGPLAGGMRQSGTKFHLKTNGKE